MLQPTPTPPIFMTTQNIVEKYSQTLCWLIEPRIPSSICLFSLYDFQCCYSINWYWVVNRSTSQNTHCVKSVGIRSFSDPHFPAFWQNTERWELFLSIQFKCEKMRTRKTPNTDTFHAVTRSKITTKMRVQMNEMWNLFKIYNKYNKSIGSILHKLTISREIEVN